MEFPRVAFRPVRFDREHLVTFARYLLRRFIDDRCFETAGALSYTTLFALVPLTAAAIGILSAFPVFDTWTQRLADFVFRNFVPTAGATIRDYVLAFAGNISRMTVVGILVLLASALMMMSAIEDRLNRIWRVDKRRSSVARFLVYWAALTLGPILAVGGLALSSYLVALPVINRAASQSLVHDVLLRLLPSVLTLLAMLFLYVFVPNRRVAWRHAFVGALLAALLFEFAKWGFAQYVGNFPSYQLLYGALAVIPIFLVWVYLSWVIVLLGASIAASLSSFEYRPLAERLPPGAEFLGLLHVLKHFVAAQREGRVLAPGEFGRRERFLSEDLVQRAVSDLVAAGMVEETDGRGWVLCCGLDSHGLGRVYEIGRYRLPLDRSLEEHWNAGLPPPLQKALKELAESLRERLNQPLMHFYPQPSPARPETDPPSPSP